MMDEKVAKRKTQPMQELSFPQRQVILKPVREVRRKGLTDR